MVTVTELWIYPVKSCQGISLEKAEVTHKGLAGDRQWMIVDQEGKFITQRTHPQLAKVQTALSDEYLILKFEQQESLQISTQQQGDLIPVTVWRSQTQGIDQGDAAAAWFGQILDMPCRLVRQAPEQIRPINPDYALWENQPVSFADGYPMLLTNTASLTELNRRISAQNIPMNRFRPNFVVKGDRPFAEDDWQHFTINGLEFVVAKPCERCVVTTTDQKSGDRPSKEPLQTLRKFRYQPEQGILFGINLMPRNEGFLAVSDEVNFSKAF